MGSQRKFQIIYMYMCFNQIKHIVLLKENSIASQFFSTNRSTVIRPTSSNPVLVLSRVPADS